MQALSSLMVEYGLTLVFAVTLAARAGVPLPAAPLLVVAGGVLYSLGVIFHAWRRLRFQNAIWHCFVLLGAACHYTAVLDLVMT